ncbi:MAG: aldo/keto reductase [Chloroflexi bacterium]|nr:aldo/keto reductase [Chloroflexota bacterium]
MPLPSRPLGRTGLHTTLLGFGGAPIGFAPSPDRHAFIALVRRAYELGINFFDSAPDYRESESIISEALRPVRRAVILSTKVGRIQTWSGSTWDVHEDWSAAGIAQTIERSLTQLQTDVLDLVQLHSPPPWVLERGEAVDALQHAQREGKLRHIGVSGDGDCARLAIALGVFDTLQISYSILEQESSELVALASARGMGIIVKQPLANGIANLRAKPAHDDWIEKWQAAQAMDWTALARSEERLSFSLRWLLSDARVSTAIVGTTRADHLETNVAAAMQPALDEGTMERARAEYQRARKQT